MRKINVLLFGYGNTGRLIADGVERHGGRVCGIVDADRRLWGETAHGVRIEGDGEHALLRSEADIAVISVGSSLEMIAPMATAARTPAPIQTAARELDLYLG